MKQVIINHKLIELSLLETFRYKIKNLKTNSTITVTVGREAGVSQLRVFLISVVNPLYSKNVLGRQKLGVTQVDLVIRITLLDKFSFPMCSHKPVYIETNRSLFREI